MRFLLIRSTSSEAFLISCFDGRLAPRIVAYNLAVDSKKVIFST